MREKIGRDLRRGEIDHRIVVLNWLHRRGVNTDGEEEGGKRNEKIQS